MHTLNSEASHALTPREPKPFKVNQMYDESIERELKGDFKESIVALGKTMEDANLALKFRLL